MKEQIIKLSEGCPYSCPFCFNGKNDFKEFGDLPEVESNKVIFHDDAFLSLNDPIKIIEHYGSQKYNGKVVYYEILQGINKKDLNQSIANALHKNRFKNIRIAWDGSYTKKNLFKVLDAIKILNRAGYKRHDLMCYILSNYYVSLPENMLKLRILLQQNVLTCNCRYRKNYLDPKIYYEHWTKKEVDYFKDQCRGNNQIINFNGYDPEVEKRLIRTKPSSIPDKEIKQ